MILWCVILMSSGKICRFGDCFAALPCFAWMLQVFRICEYLDTFIVNLITHEGRHGHQKVQWCVAFWFYLLITITTWDMVDISLDFSHFSAFVDLCIFSMIYRWHNKLGTNSELVKCPVMCGALILPPHCHHYLRYGWDIIGFPTLHFCWNVDISIKSIE